MDVRVSADPAAEAARLIVDRLALVLGDRGSASLAVSGGSTAPALFAAIRGGAADHVNGPPLDWDRIEVWQVDERIAPDGDSDRNATQLAGIPAVNHPMPVTAADLDAAVIEYASALPPRFDVVHLGLGDDGHTASWAPKPHPDVARALTSEDRVFTIAEFNGRRRMTLGVDVVNAAGLRVLLVLGEEKAPAVARWIDGLARHDGHWIDETLPVAAVEPSDTVLCLDAAAADGLGADGYGQGR